VGFELETSALRVDATTSDFLSHYNGLQTYVDHLDFTTSRQCADELILGLRKSHARIAQLNVVQLTNDLTAAALAYGYFQKNLPAAALTSGDGVVDGGSVNVNAADARMSAPPLADRPRLVVFVDFGHSGIQSGEIFSKLFAFCVPFLKMRFSPQL
jgi:hypothetical protein